MTKECLGQTSKYVHINKMGLMAGIILRRKRENTKADISMTRLGSGGIESEQAEQRRDTGPCTPREKDRFYVDQHT